MKILFINYEYPPLGGGAGNAFYYLLEEFKKYPSLQIDAVVASHLNIATNQMLTPQINLYRLPVGIIKNLHHQSNLNLINFSYQLFFLLNRLTKHQTYNHNLTFFTLPCGLISFLFRRRVPYSIFLRGSDVPFYNKRFYWADYILFKHLAKIIWRNAQNVVANSNDLKQLALKTAPSQNIKIINNGIDTNIFKPASNHSNQPFTILSTSRLIKRKNLHLLLEAFSLFFKKNPTSCLLLAGSGNLESDLKKLAHQLNIASATNFVGHLSYPQLIAVYQQADLFVLPSSQEGMSNSLLEAMSCGLPVIASNTGDASLLIKDSGLIINQLCSKNILEAMEVIYLNPHLRQKMSLAGRQQSLKLSWSNIAQQYLNLL